MIASNTQVEKRYVTCPHCGGRVAIDEAVFKKATESAKVDWQSLDVQHKLLAILGAREWALVDGRWPRRIANHPEQVAEVLDIIHANLNEGTVIKNRGAYAEELWKKATDL